MVDLIFKTLALFILFSLPACKKSRHQTQALSVEPAPITQNNQPSNKPNQLNNPPSQPNNQPVVAKSCVFNGDSIANGADASRTRFESSSVAAGANCVAQKQKARCNNGKLGEFSGAYIHASCKERPKVIVQPSTPAINALKSKISTAMLNSTLSVEQLAEHAVNRMTYGPSYRFSDGEQIHFNPQALIEGVESKKEAIEAIADFVARQVLSDQDKNNKDLNLAVNALKAIKISDTIKDFPVDSNMANWDDYVTPGSVYDTFGSCLDETNLQTLRKNKDSFRDEVTRKVIADNKLRKLKDKNSTPLSVGRINTTRGKRCIKFYTYLKFIRSIYSKNQFREKITDFWFDHLNVDVDKAKEYFGNYYERVIRDNLSGTYPNLLLRSAKSPAMLLYLDNDSNKFVAGDPTSINENYAREILELHTFGVGPEAGVYTQDDIRAAARLLAGWGVNDDTRTFEFRKAQSLLTSNQKGVAILKRGFGSGLAGGEAFVNFIASHPRTHKNLAEKLVRRFVVLPVWHLSSEADRTRVLNLRNSLISEVAQAIGAQGLQAAYEKMVSHPAFWDAQTFRRKIKRPVDYAVSFYRQLGAAPNDLLSDKRKRLDHAVNFASGLSHTLFKFSDPTGYDDYNGAWMSPYYAIAATKFSMQATELFTRSKAQRVTLDTNAELALQNSVDPAKDLLTTVLPASFGLRVRDPNGVLHADKKEFCEKRYSSPDREGASWGNSEELPVRSVLSTYLGSNLFHRY